MTTPRKPRKQRNQSTPKPEHNPLSEAIQATRKAYGSSSVPRGTIQPKDGGSKQGGDDSRKDDTGKARVGAVICSPLPPLRTRGNVANATLWVESLTDQQVEAWATSFVATGKRQQWLLDSQPALGRENNATRADLVRCLERHPVAVATIARLKSELVLSDLERRRKLKDIALSSEHELRGYSDHIKAIELDAKLDPESNLGKAKDSAQAVFQAPVNLFFCSSTQATKQSAGPEQPTIDV